MKEFEDQLRVKVSEFVNNCPDNWRDRTNLIKHIFAEWGRSLGYQVHYKIERDSTSNLAKLATSESPYNLDLAWSDEPVDIYFHEQSSSNFKDVYKGYSGLILIMESEWAQYGVSHSSDLRLRSMVKDFRKLVWSNALYKIFVYCSMYESEMGPDSELLAFISEKILKRSQPNGQYYAIELSTKDNLTQISIYKFDLPRSTFARV